MQGFIQINVNYLNHEKKNYCRNSKMRFFGILIMEK